MTWRDMSAVTVRICALAVLILGTWFAFTTQRYPPLYVFLLVIGWLAGLVGIVEQRRGASKAAAMAFLTVAVVVPNFFAEALNLVLLISVVAYFLASRVKGDGLTGEHGMSRSYGGPTRGGDPH